MSAFPKKIPHLSPKISDDSFFHRPFSCFIWYFFIGGAKSVADIATGGPKSFSTKSQYYHYSFCPGGGPNSIANFDVGAMAGFAPLDPPLYTYIRAQTAHRLHTRAPADRTLMWLHTSMYACPLTKNTTWLSNHGWEPKGVRLCTCTV